MKKVSLLLLVGMLFVSLLHAELFTVLDTVNIADNLTKNNGGIGNIIAGVDVDNDGKTELYMVNDNWNDGAEEIIPRIYKYEKVGAEEWELVWQAIPPTNIVDAQNTWPTLSLTDLDKDGKQELTWGIVNNSSGNPARIVVYEHAGDDNFGVANGDVWEPNAHWSIVEEDGKNIRPVNWKIEDIDSDGVDEIIFAGRKGDMTIGIVSVDDIPDDGDGSEVWTLEFELPGVDTYTGDNKWDAAVLGNNAYFFDEVEISKVSWNGSAYIYTSLSPLPGGISFDAVQVCDIDGNGTLEMITGEYSYGDGSKSLWLLEEEADTLKRTLLADINGAELLNGGRLMGGATGDIDADGKMDFVFGSRFSGPPNGMIFRFEYQGGDIADGANYELSIIDSAFAYIDLAESGCWNVIEIANVDDDAGLEVLYTSSSSIPYSSEYATTNVSAPVIILDSPNTDPIATAIEEEPTTVVNDYVLFPAYPNPFNPTTTIDFKIPIQEHVQLAIYDIQGRKIVSLVNSQLRSGKHSFKWNGTNDRGVQVSTGIYIYRLKTENYVKMRRMTFIK